MPSFQITRIAGRENLPCAKVLILPVGEEHGERDWSIPTDLEVVQVVMKETPFRLRGSGSITRV
jgi:hypothetical protein